MKLRIIGFLLVVTLLSAGKLCCTELQPSFFDTEQQKIRYGFNGEQMFAAAGDEFTEFSAEQAAEEASDLKLKSPAKAFFMSLAVPGLGQYYYGSKWKPVVFLGAEVATWVFHFKWHGEGDDLTDDYEAFNRAHWSKSDYQDKYLYWVYGVTDDDDVPQDFKEISHNLPDTETQQYFEMTGKYDQFVWGWDDAVLSDGRTLDDFDLSAPPPRVYWQDSIPNSANRMTYETMRNDANSKYDDANKMLMVVFANHLISAFEAFFVTRSHNNQIGSRNDTFGQVQVRAKLKSVYTKRDTPYLQFTYRF